MILRRVRVGNKLGLHARAAARLVRLASGYSSEIHISRAGENRRMDAKSILGILMLAAPEGTELELSAEGADEQDASGAICRLIEDRFGEAE